MGFKRPLVQIQSLGPKGLNHNDLSLFLFGKVLYCVFIFLFEKFILELLVIV